MKAHEIGLTNKRAFVEIRDQQIVVDVNGEELHWYELADLVTHKQILRVVYQLLEKPWVEKQVVMDFIKLVADYNGITYRS